MTKVTEYLRGKTYWAKILGAPRMNFQEDGKEWTFEFEPDEEGLQVFLKHGLGDRIKGKGYAVGQKGQFKDREPFIILKKSELTKDGKPNSPIRVYDQDDEPWEDNTLIGNGSTVDVKINIKDYGPGKKKGIYPEAVRVQELVRYESNEFARRKGIKKLESRVLIEIPSTHEKSPEPPL